MSFLKEYKATIIFVLIIVLIIGGLTLLELNKNWQAEKKQEEEEKIAAEEKEKKQQELARYNQIEEEKFPIATITMKDKSVIKIRLYPNIAPTTVENFISLANSGFYDGLTFHRTMPDFMIQGGDPNGNGTGNAGYTIEGEFSNNDIENTLSHTIGTLSMARGNDNDSASSQFFITTTDDNAMYLDGIYAGFGKVIEGMDVVINIANVDVVTRDDESDEANRPIEPPIIESIRVETFDITYSEPTKIEL